MQRAAPPHNSQLAEQQAAAPAAPPRAGGAASPAPPGAPSLSAPNATQRDVIMAVPPAPQAPLGPATAATPALSAAAQQQQQQRLQARAAQPAQAHAAPPPLRPPAPGGHAQQASQQPQAGQGNAVVAERGCPKKTRLVWTAELHTRFLFAVEQLGLRTAVPRTILQVITANVIVLLYRCADAPVDVVRLHVSCCLHPAAAVSLVPPALPYTNPTIGVARITVAA